MNTKFTPEPWGIDTENQLLVRASGRDDGNQIVVADCNLTAYKIGCNAVGDIETVGQLKLWEKTNAKLIAAAPAMFKKLNDISKKMEASHDTNGHYCMTLSLLNEIKGILPLLNNITH